MASTISAATLTVTITEAVTLNGYDQGSSNSLTISSINEVFVIGNWYVWIDYSFY